MEKFMISNIIIYDGKLPLSDPPKEEGSSASNSSYTIGNVNGILNLENRNPDLQCTVKRKSFSLICGEEKKQDSVSKTDLIMNSSSKVSEDQSLHRKISCSLQPINREGQELPPSTEIAADRTDIKEENIVEQFNDILINTTNEYLNKHENGKGIWYPHEYSAHLKNEFDQEMNPSFYDGYANEEFFNRNSAFLFELKQGKKASDALLSFLKGPTVADCGNATVACYYKTLLDILGQEKFDQLFSNPPILLTIGQGMMDPNSPLSYLAEFTESSKYMEEGSLGKRPLKIGDECHFGGIKWYANKHPKGFDAGWNVIYAGDNERGEQLFIAHGFEKPLTEREINQKLVTGYNQKRTLQDRQYIANTVKPRLYDKKINKFLSSYSIISSDEVEQSPNKFIKGYFVGSSKRINVNDLISLKESNNIQEFLHYLIHRVSLTPLIY